MEDSIEASLTDYEERYSLTGNLLLLVIAWLTLAVVAVMVGVAVLAQEPAQLGDLIGNPGLLSFIVILVLAAIISGSYGASWLFAARTGQVALRVNRHGVWFGRQPFPPKRPVLVPWSSIDTIVVFNRLNREAGNLQITFGVQLRPGAPRPSAVPALDTVARPLRAWAKFANPMWCDIDRRMRGWDLNTIALQGAVWMHGRHVRIFDFR